MVEAVGNRFLALLQDSDRVKDTSRTISRLGMRDMAKLGMAIAPPEEDVTAQRVKRVGPAVGAEDLHCLWKPRRMEPQALKNGTRRPMAIEQCGQSQIQIWSP